MSRNSRFAYLLSIGDFALDDRCLAMEEVEDVAEVLLHHHPHP